MSGSKPDPNSMVRRIEAFYRENPDEWLTWEDLVAKFDLGTVQHAKEVVARVRDRLGMRLVARSVVVWDREGQP